MDEKNWFSQLTADQKRAMADKLNTSVEWLYQINCGSKPGAKLASQIHEYSQGRWSKHDLRPDVFGASEISSRAH